jgi:hypothetical protein
VSRSKNEWSSPHTPSWRGAPLKHGDTFAFIHWINELHNTFIMLCVLRLKHKVSNSLTYSYLMYTKFWSGNPKGRDHSEDHFEHGRIILEWILRKWDRKVWIGFI